jgi:hypothetical protein
MILKILNIENDTLIRNGKDSSSIFAGRLKQEAMYANSSFFAYSYIMEINSDSSGVGSSSGASRSLKEYLEENGQTLLKCRFIFVSIKHKVVLYDGKIDDVYELMSQLFNVKSNQINPIVDLDDIEKLSSLTITTTANGQMSSIDLKSNVFNENDLLHELGVNLGQVNSSTYKVKFVKEGAFFQRDKLKEIINDSSTGLRRIVIEGYDDNGAEIKLTSLLSKKMTIFEDRSSWNDKVTMNLEDVYNEIVKRL